MDVLAARLNGSHKLPVPADGIDHVGELAGQVGLDADAAGVQHVPDLLAVELEGGFGGEQLVVEALGEGMADLVIDRSARPDVGESELPCADEGVFLHLGLVNHVAGAVLDYVAGPQHLAVVADVILGEPALGQGLDIQRAARGLDLLVKLLGLAEGFDS